MDVFDHVKIQFAYLAERGTFDRELARWRKSSHGLSDVESFDNLVGRLAASAPRSEARDGILAAICVLARRDEVARTLTIGLMLPGLLEVVAHIRSGSWVLIEEVHAEVLVNFWAAVRAIEPDTRNVAQRLINAARFRTYRWLAVESTWRRSFVLEPELLLAAAPFGRTAEETALALIFEAVDAGVLSEVDAAIVAHDGRSWEMVAARYGLSKRAGRKRRASARAALRPFVEGRFLDEPDHKPSEGHRVANVPSQSPSND